MTECYNYSFLFSVLPMVVDENSTVIRHLFLKMHTSREKCPKKPEYQTLFIIGVPDFCEEVNKICFNILNNDL